MLFRSFGLMFGYNLKMCSCWDWIYSHSCCHFDLDLPSGNGANYPDKAYYNLTNMSKAVSTKMRKSTSYWELWSPYGGTDWLLTSICWLQNVKKTTPGIAFTEVGRVLGDKWKKMSGMYAWSWVNWFYAFSTVPPNPILSLFCECERPSPMTTYIRDIWGPSGDSYSVVSLKAL